MYREKRNRMLAMKDSMIGTLAITMLVTIACACILAVWLLLAMTAGAALFQNGYEMAATALAVAVAILMREWLFPR